MARRSTARSSRSSRTSSRRAGGPITIPSLKDAEARVVIPEGDYGALVKKVEEDEGDAGPYLRWTFEIIDEGKYEGKSPKPYITSFAENALWNLRGLLEALGVEIPDEAFDIDPKEMVDKELIITIRHTEYDGRTQSEVTGDFMPIDEGEAATAEPEPATRRSRRAAKEPEAEPETHSSRRSRRAAAEPEPEPETTSRRSRRAAKEPEPEPEKTTTRSRRGAKAKEPEPDVDPVTQDEVNDMNEEELEDLLKELDIELDLSKFRTLRKMRAAVIDACEEADLLEK
jgi:hypothetical protein